MSKDVLIIGAGVVGLSAAYYCARRGCRVTILERHAPQRDGCSYGNAGLVVPSHVVPLAAPGMVWLGLKWMLRPRSPFYIRPRLSRGLWEWGYRFWRAATHEHVARSAPLLRDLHLASRACYEELAAIEDNSIGLERDGLLVLCQTQRGLDEEAHAAAGARALGLPAEVLDAAAAAALEPDVQMNIAGAVHYPLDCRLDPARLMATLEREIARLGVRTVWQAEVTGWRREGERLAAACTFQGQFPADEFVLCAGSWSPAVVQGLPLRLPLEAGKGYSLTLPQPPRMPRRAAILAEARVAVTPLGSALRFGGTMEMAGLDQRINPQRVQGILAAVPAYYPQFTAADFAGVAPWCGLRPCTPDGLPYLGRAARVPNLVVATGHAMLGVSLGPITGRIVADLIDGRPPPLDLALLAPDRYAGRGQA